MTQDQLSALIACATFAAFTAHVTLDNALALIAYIRSPKN